MTDNAQSEIAKRRGDILSKLAADAGDEPPALVAVSKRQSDARIDAALVAGQRIFGENRVQEAISHWEARKADYSDLQLRLIGPLQTNKAEEAVHLFDVIETLDRPKLARHLAAAIEKTDSAPDILIQVNTGEEPQKSGVIPADLQDLLQIAREDCGLNIVGLMCIPPQDEPPGPHFALLAKLAAMHGLSQLSMGMSADYETAARFGATHVRVGSAFFGPREA